MTEAGGAFSEDEALTEAARTGESVEVLSLRGESRDVFATPDGSFEAREYLRPVRARVDGEWQDVDTGLAAREDGMVGPGVTTVDMAFSGGGADAPLVRMVRAGRSLEVYWPGTLPAPTLDGSTAVYEDVLPDVDLRMGAQVDGYTQLLVVHTPEAARSPQLAELTLGLETQGLTMEATAEGGLEAVDEGAGSPVFEAPAPMMWDSGSGPAPAADGASGLAEVDAASSPRQARVGVEVTDEALVLTPDAGILHGADTEFPVYIDPQTHTPRATAWTMASRYWHDSPQWMFNGENNAGLGYCGWDYCKPNDLKRLFYRMPVSHFAGTEVISARFSVGNVYSASCTAREVQLWRTWTINSQTTWDTQNTPGFWAEHLDTRSFAHGWDGCAAKDAEFNVTAAVRESVANGASTLTLGMRATSEDDPLTWKRFSERAYLSVTYNRRPTQIRTSQLSMEYGGVCKPPSSPAYVGTRGRITARDVTDPDGENVRVEFGARWDTGDGQGNIMRWRATTVSKTSGSLFEMFLPSNIPTNRRVEWFARAYDGHSYSPWSSDGSAERCAFIYDPTRPQAPAVSSPQYPEANPDDPNDPWHDGMGKYGSFTFDAPDSDVVAYQYGINSDPLAANTVNTSGGAARTVQVLPQEPGDNYITVRSLDAANNASEIRTYDFMVRAGEPERMVWDLNEDAGVPAVTGEGEPWSAALAGGATPGAEGVRGDGLRLDGQGGHATAKLPVLDTSKSFTVSLWARLPDAGVTSRGTAVSQSGTNAWAFRISADPATGWSFARTNSDSNPLILEARQGEPAAAGEWTHVAGVFDNVSSRLLLYINGGLAGTAPWTVPPWEARGATTLGAAMNGADGPGSFFSGDLDEVRFYDYGLSAAQIAQVSAHEDITEGGRPAVAVWAMEEPADATSVQGRSQQTRAQLQGGAEAGVTGIQAGALSFDGSTGYAATTQPVLDTHQSFAVSLWAWLPAGKENVYMTAATQGGLERRGFSLYHRPNGGGWSFLRATADEPDAPNVEVIHNPCLEGELACPGLGLGTWSHVVGVHDMDGQRLQLYINGELVGSQPYTYRWNATGPVMLGASDSPDGIRNHMKGLLDDVRFYDRVITAEEVRQLYEQRPLITGRWQFEGTQGTSPVTTPDSSRPGNSLTLGGGAAVGPGWIDSGALVLDGVDDYAQTTTVPVDTTASFTVAGWVQAAAMPEEGVTLFSAAGQQRSAFAVRFLPSSEAPGWGQWEITVPDADSASASVVSVTNPRYYDVLDWNHVAIVYDGFRREVELYVNGQRIEDTCHEELDDPCGGLSWSDNVLSFRARHSLQVGRSRSNSAWTEYWPGAIDDLWAFQGKLSPSQVALLSTLWSDAPTEIPNPR
ncbi:LamG-like jellyroll fold domain-containing protein [Streptomyces litchfieldiae]|uniref:LamG-like jellyroll fold domain-containing protein n=1 Tax=Streptomyces litchfieldiae TaxID=3075543 RepID=A0ABU2MW50_9ACTN|nr:LamG-like jellyroll fold domain-containing protein [Streptomyces sp. DSM 44938]MDT0345873.1 LamG-like jellyroll fold domain-containing protein [Streptomyces sp. DSM 44938]